MNESTNNILMENLILWNIYYVVSALGDNSIEYIPKKSLKRKSFWWNFKKVEHLKLTNIKDIWDNTFDYEMYDWETWWIYISSFWYVFNNKLDAENFCRFSNNNLLKEIKDYAENDFWILF
jgi:hypothetical protein